MTSRVSLTTVTESRYPESIDVDHADPVGEAVYDLIRSLGLDDGRGDHPDWNPFAELVGLGGRVLIKPNLVISSHELGMPGLLATVAHPSVLRPLIELAFRAVGPEGHIVIGDAPIKEVDFDEVATTIGLRRLVEDLRLRGVPVELRDFRDLKAVRDHTGTIIRTERLPGDADGQVTYDLGDESAFRELTAESYKRLRSTAAVYEDAASTNHQPGRNRYSITASVVSADLIISVAKLKSHRKSGMTAALKNVIGMTNEKRWLPHHRIGTPSQGGDICPDGAPLRRKMGESARQWANASRHGRVIFTVLKPAVRLAGSMRRKVVGTGENALDVGEGDWWGNDTIWRTTLDMNVLIRYGRADGSVATEPQRSYLAIIDAVLAGDGEGPLHPDPKPLGTLLASVDPVACDLVAATIAGFDFRKIPMIARAEIAARRLGTNVTGEIEVITPDGVLSVGELPNHHFRPSSGWRGFIER